MKKIAFVTLLLILAATTATAFADQRDITVNWEMSNTDGISGYTVYFAYSSDMSDQQVACQTSNPSATQLQCSNVNITSYPVYLTVAAMKDSGGEISSDVAKGPVPAPKNLRVVE